jgi:hypothetical protein
MNETPGTRAFEAVDWYDNTNAMKQMRHDQGWEYCTLARFDPGQKVITEFFTARAYTKYEAIRLAAIKLADAHPHLFRVPESWRIG